MHTAHLDGLDPAVHAPFTAAMTDTLPGLPTRVRVIDFGLRLLYGACVRPLAG